jgi:hypothetical protein
LAHLFTVSARVAAALSPSAVSQDFPAGSICHAIYNISMPGGDTRHTYMLEHEGVATAPASCVCTLLARPMLANKIYQQLSHHNLCQNFQVRCAALAICQAAAYSGHLCTLARRAFVGRPTMEPDSIRLPYRDNMHNHVPPSCVCDCSDCTAGTHSCPPSLYALGC